MRVMTRCASVLLTMWLWGCGAVSLDEMNAPVIEVWVPDSATSEEGEPLLFIQLRESGTDCPDLSEDTRAFFNDVSVPLSSAGHLNNSFLPGLSPSSCYPSLFMSQGSAIPASVTDEVSRVRLTEGDATFHAEARAVCADRSLTLVSPADGVLRPGQAVELAWQPATDELLIARVSVTIERTLQVLARIEDGTLQVEGNRLRFTMPQLPGGMAGSSELLFGSASDMYRPQVLRCEGFAECNFRCACQSSCNRYPPPVRVTLQP